MTAPDIPAIRALIERIRSESNLADRPGQMARLESIAIELESLLALVPEPASEDEWEDGGYIEGPTTAASGYERGAWRRPIRIGPREPVEAGDPDE